jgi:hypothetical protein
MRTRNPHKRGLILPVLAALLLTTALSGCSAAGNTPAVSTSPAAAAMESVDSEPAADAMSRTVVYQNTDYGFDFTLPESWKGYTIVSEEWQGYSISDAANIITTGPKLSIRNPKWTEATPTQDIPIMIFTLQQWQDLLKEKFAVSAAPIPPSELGRNSKYVFALPARYNFAFPAGYEEVEKILSGKPLQPTENFK